MLCELKAVSLLRRLCDDRRGNVLAIGAVALPLLLGSAGLATDTVQWALWKRQLQRAADSAAFAGVYASLQNASANTGVTQDLSNNNHLWVSLLNGYPQVTEPGDTGTNTSTVEVSLAVQQKLPFSSMFMSEPPTVKVTARAAAVEAGDYCVVSLEKTSVTGVTATGTANVNLGCGIITNSTASEAATAPGSSTINATPIAAVGGVAAGNWGSATLLPYSLPQEDPFAGVEAATPAGTCPNVLVEANQSATLAAGCYSTITLKGNVTLSDGTYVLDGGSLVIESHATVRCNSCTLVFTNRNTSSTATIGTVSIAGGAQVNLAAPGTGTYAGILMYQDRRASDANNYIRGSSSSSFQGAFYFPSQHVEFAGTAGMQTNCMQLVARRVTFAGSSGISNSCPANSGASSFTGRRVRLIG